LLFVGEDFRIWGLFASAKKMGFQKPWSWDEAAQAFTLKFLGGKALYATKSR
jgi:hypothetical protein